MTNAEENPHAGKGSSVLLDIGEGVGAIVLTLPSSLEDAEIERRPTGTHDHAHEHEHDHGHGHTHTVPHVAVVPRTSPEGALLHSAVFFDVPEGTYDLYLLPNGPTGLTLEVTSGHVTEATWPA
jgi:ABC-type nickel/cobalt efflux system permease component RcnA